MDELDAVATTAMWMQFVAILTAAADSGADERRRRARLDSLALGAQIVASRVLALLPVEAGGDPSVAITVYARRVFAHGVCVHHPTQTTAVHR